jgi:hypothetical protein
MPDARPVGGLLLGLGLGWLALALRLGLGLAERAQGLGRQGRALALLLLALGLLEELLTRPEPSRPAPRPPRGRRNLVLVPAHLREEWAGDLAEVCGQWHQHGYARWSIRLWTLGWLLQLVETRVRCAVYAAVWAHRWKKP